jgi:Protein of unknown function (DUF742)
VPDEEWFDDEAGPMVRPYAVTRGRTAPGDNLELVALVATTEKGLSVARLAHSGLLPEQHDIAMLCLRLQSVAEISARLKLPLVVTRVLVSDMAGAGLVSVQRPAHSPRPDSELLRKVLDGLSRL